MRGGERIEKRAGFVIRFKVRFRSLMSSELCGRGNGVVE